jgi:hypothetical protein
MGQGRLREPHGERGVSLNSPHVQHQLLGIALENVERPQYAVEVRLATPVVGT